jgi:hypothetical protein
MGGETPDSISFHPGYACCLCTKQSHTGAHLTIIYGKICHMDNYSHSNSGGESMRTRINKLALLLGLLSSPVAFAGPYTDDLSKCLVNSTTKEDRVALVKWMFSAASVHPAVKSMVSVSAKQLDDANKRTADLFMNLLTISCKSEAEKALQYEGEVTFQTSFQILGQVAGQELFSSPEVVSAMSGLEKYIDGKKLESLAKQN